MKTNHLFTAFLAFLLPIASLCKEHRLVDASNLRKKTEVISDKLKGPSLKQLLKFKIPEEKMDVLKGIAASVCDEDDLEMTKVEEINSQIKEARFSYLCSAESIGFVVSAVSAALTEVAGTETMTKGFLGEQEGETFLVAAGVLSVVSTGMFIFSL